MKRINYDDIAPDLKTGDIILMRGLSLESVVIEAIEGSIYSHVGMIIRPDDIGVTHNGLLFWESNTLVNLKDVILNKAKTGPMIVDLRERLVTNKKDFSDFGFTLRYLEVERNTDMMKRLRSFIDSVHNSSFPETWEFIKDFFEGRTENKSNKDGKYFCSQLLAASYIHMGLLAGTWVPNGYAPKDYSQSKEIAPLLKRASFSREIPLDI